MTVRPTHSVSVAGVVVHDDGRVLAIRRADNGLWQAPGGILEPSERLEDGVRREVAEETGIDVEVERLTGVYQNLTLGVVSLVFRCRPVGGTPTPSEESPQVEWLTLDEVHDRMRPVFAVRVTDAFEPGTAFRSHDGTQIIPSSH